MDTDKATGDWGWIARAQHKATEWSNRCETIERRLTRERGRTSEGARTLSVFWSTQQVLTAAIYQRPPQVAAVARHGSRDAVIRAAAEVYEDAIGTLVDDRLDEPVRAIIDDWLRYGRGVGWIEHDVAGTEPALPYLTYIAREDFVCDPRARVWADVQRVARRHWLSLEDARTRWPEASKLEAGEDDEVAVWEVWDRVRGDVRFIREGGEGGPLEVLQPRVQFPGGFPCPRPLLSSVLVPKTLLPIPDVVQYQDQLDEVDRLTSRIAALTDALKLRGFYAAGTPGAEGIERAFHNSSDRAVLVPVDHATLGTGSFRDAVVWLPVDQVMATIRGLTEVRRTLLEDIYQLTGISDILRGAEAAEERTATEVTTRAAWGSQRVRTRQLEIARFLRDAVRLIGAVALETFPPEVWLQLAGKVYPTDEQRATALQAQQMREQAGLPPVEGVDETTPTIEGIMTVMKAGQLYLDIETDSTLFAQENADKEARMEFVTTIGTMLQAIAQAATIHPALAKFGVTLVEFAADGFRVGRGFEADLDTLRQAVEPGQPGQSDQPDQLSLAQGAHGMTLQRMQAEAMLQSQTGQEINGQPTEV